MRVLKQSTAVTVLLGPFLDRTDGYTEEAGLATTATEISKAGAAFGAGPALGTHDSDGWYPIALTTTHTNTLGDLTVKCHDNATHLPVWAHFTVLPANAFDGIVSGSGVGLRSDVQGWLGSAVAAVTVAGVPEVDVTHWRGTAAAAPTVAGVPAVEVIDISAAGQTDIRAAVGLAAANLDTQITTLATAANLATVAGYLDTEIAAILADTNELQTDWVNGGRLDLILDARASQTAVDDLPTNAELTTALGTADDAVLAQVALVKAKTDSLTFTVAGQLDANVQSVNDVAVAGDGAATPWGP